MTDFILYKTPDNKVSINVQIEDETVWLTQDQAAELFDRSKPTIVEYLGKIFDESELDENSVIRKYRITEKSIQTCRYIQDIFNRKAQSSEGSIVYERG